MKKVVQQWSQQISGCVDRGWLRLFLIHDGSNTPIITRRKHEMACAMYQVTECGALLDSWSSASYF